MKSTTRLIKSILAMLIATNFCSVSAFAEGDLRNNHEGVSAGPGVVVSDTPYKGTGTKTHIFPFVIYQGRHIYLRGPRLGYRLYDKNKLSIDALANWRFDSYEEDDSRDLIGMNDRDMTMELGAALSFKDGFGITRLSFLNDILGKHDGQLLSLSYGKIFRKDKFTFTPFIGLKWQSKNYVGYYYGVSSKESLPSRPTYHPSDALNPFASLGITYKLNEHWNIYSGLKYEWLNNEISDSPIVDKNYQTSLMLGLMYSF